MKGLLVVVPCGLGKIWDKSPHQGPTLARDAYTGSPFKINRHYAEHFAERWVILSAKYGFIAPEFVIAGPYNVTFKQPSTNPVALATLRKQIKEQKLERFQTVIGLGGTDYRSQVQGAFHGEKSEVEFPFAGLPIGKMMQATNLAVSRNDPHYRSDLTDQLGFR